MKDYYVATTLMSASYRGYLSAVQEMIRSGVKLDVDNNYDWTALFLAVQNGHLSIVKEFIRNGVDVNVVDRHGYTPLIYAATYGHAFICIFLLLNGADTTILRREKNYLQFACLWRGNEEQFFKEMFCTEHVTEEMKNGSLVDKVSKIHLAKKKQ